MNNSNYINFLELQEEIKSQFHGGIDGLEILFTKHINKLKANNHKLSHTNFVDFYSGKDVEVLGINNESFLKNTGKLNNICVKDFYETTFLFVYETTPFDVFNHPNNLLQETLSKIKKIVLSEQFDKEQKSLFINEILSHISTQIANSNSVKEDNDNVLKDKLVYISNGYKFISETIQRLYSKSFSLIDDFPKVVKSKTEDASDWHLVFIEIVKGNIQIDNSEKHNLKYFYLSNEFENPSKLGNHLAESLLKNPNSIRPIVTSSINGGAQKDIFIKGNLQKMNELINLHSNNMCNFFYEKYDKLKKDVLI